MTSKAEEQIERKRVLDNERKLLAQSGTTMQAFAQADAEIPGRFSQVTSANVIGSKADIAGAYPAAYSAHQVELPPEPPLGFDGFEPSTPSACVEVSGPASAPFSPVDVERAGPSYRRVR